MSPNQPEFIEDNGYLLEVCTQFRSQTWLYLREFPVEAHISSHSRLSIYKVQNKVHLWLSEKNISVCACWKKFSGWIESEWGNARHSPDTNNMTWSCDNCSLIAFKKKIWWIPRFVQSWKRKRKTPVKAYFQTELQHSHHLIITVIIAQR